MYFFSAEEENLRENLSTPIANRNQVRRVKKKEVRRKRPKRRVYQNPNKEQLIILDGQVDFIDLTSNTEPYMPKPPLQLPQPVEEKSPPSPVANLQNPVPILVVSKPTDFESLKKDQNLLDQGLEKKRTPILPSSNSSPLSVTLSITGITMEGQADKPAQVFIPRPLDILFVIDTSQSMSHHLKQFRKKFSGFLNFFEDLDWKLALTDADHGETGFFLFNIGALKGKTMPLELNGKILELHYLNPRVSNYNEIFLDSVSKHKFGEYTTINNEGQKESVQPCHLPPFCQGLQEQPLKALKSALIQNEGFFRKSADLAVVIISNSKERGGDFRAVEPKEVIEQFRKTYGVQKRFEVYGIIITEEDEDCLKQNQDQQFWFPEGAFSKKIADLSLMTGGQVFNICAPHYQEVAQSIFHSFGRSPVE